MCGFTSCACAITGILRNGGLTRVCWQGGLNLRTDQLAWPLSIGGIVLVVFALTIYPKLQARLGPLAAAKIGMVAAVPVVMLIPATSYVRG